jgi:hypothetical protein
MPGKRGTTNGIVVKEPSESMTRTASVVISGLLLIQEMARHLDILTHAEIAVDRYFNPLVRSMRTV